MNFINQLFSSSQTSFDPLNFIGIIVTVIASIYIFKGETSVSFNKERHDKLIFPIFNLLEPILYTDFQIDVLEEALKIIDDNKNLADGRLLELHYLCTKNPSIENFKSLCAYIDAAYDKSCRKLGLKIRSIAYRVNRHQYKNKFYLILLVAIYTIASFAIGICILFIMLYAISVLIALYESANQTNQMIIAIIGMILGIAFLKYMEKKH